MTRVSFLVDGFNLYHSAKDASRALNGAGTRWLDIDALCKHHLYVLGSDASLAGIYYFSALAYHLTASNPGVVDRHETYLACLEDTGVRIELARFKQKRMRCPICGKVTVRHEEKETDVAIAVQLIELFHEDHCETAVIMTGDTDVAPAIRPVQRLFPDRRIIFAFPFGRKNKELASLAPGSFKLGSRAYVQNQFTDPHITNEGKTLSKPAGW